MDRFPLARAAALARLERFAPRAGSAYGARRNLVDAGGQHENVSRLSAALRRRLVGEDEVLRSVLGSHRFDKAEKFIAEVFWRTYWKGWLEQRPGVWSSYEADLMQLSSNAGVAEATAGHTGIDAFDHWAQELAATGYLHNWARMQVASIWTFTLGLPWQLGAQWFLDRLVDADPASNTLSWRWVAGLHTAGKAYLADADRIAAMTGGRFRPDGLASVACIPDDAPPVPRLPLRQPRPLDPSLPTLVLITPEDCSLETVLPRLDVRAVAVADDLARNAWDRAALQDAAARASAHWHVPSCAGNIAMLAAQHGCRQVVTGFAPVGPVASALDRLAGTLADRGIALAEHQREWDRLCWPHCGKGFFALKTEIPRLLDRLGMTNAP
jgi:deoxyribodipyrimidine photo-lyase